MFAVSISSAVKHGSTGDNHWPQKPPNHHRHDRSSLLSSITQIPYYTSSKRKKNVLGPIEVVEEQDQGNSPAVYRWKLPHSITLIIMPVIRIIVRNHSWIGILKQIGSGNNGIQHGQRSRSPMQMLCSYNFLFHLLFIIPDG